jgi:hypothetical protein
MTKIENSLDEISIVNYREGYAIEIIYRESNYIVKTFFRIRGKVKIFKNQTEAAQIFELIYSNEIGFDLSEKQYQQLIK